MSAGLEHMMSAQEKVVRILVPLLKGVCLTTLFSECCFVQSTCCFNASQIVTFTELTESHFMLFKAEKMQLCKKRFCLQGNYEHRIH